MAASSRRCARTSTIILLSIVAPACGEQVVVRLATRVYGETSFWRRVEILGRDSKGLVPENEDWMAEEARVQLGDRQAWDRVEEAPGRIAAEGVFAGATALPALLTHRAEHGSPSHRAQASLRTQELVVLKRWLFRETHGDPYGPRAVGVALDGLIGLAGRALREELRRELGTDIDPRPAEAVLRTEARALVEELLPAIRRAKTLRGMRREEWAGVLTRHGVPVAEDEDLFSSAQMELLLTWCRARVAQALSTPARPLRPEALSFWPAGDDADERLEAIVDRVWGGEDELSAVSGPFLETLWGRYGDPSGPRFRFEARLVLPGRLLRTNGTLDGDGVVWIFRDEDLAEREVVLRADSAELNEEALRFLGARRELDPPRLVQLVDLLSRRDPEGALRELLGTAVERGSLKPLRDEKAVPEEYRLLAQELADLLDPSVEAPP